MKIESDTEKHRKKNIKKIAFPDTYVLIVSLIIFAALMSYIVPAGSYTRVQDPETLNMVVQAGTYMKVEQTPVSIIDTFMAIPKGLSKNAVTVFFIFVIGGAFGIVNSTNSINVLIGRMVSSNKSDKNSEIIIATMILVFGLAGGVVGMFEECFAFLPIMITLAIGLGYDAVVATAVLMLGLSCGYGAATLNPFTVGLAQTIAGLPLFSGMYFRWIFWFATMAVLIIYILNYCRKIKKDPSKSIVADIDYSKFTIDKNTIQTDFSKGQKAVLITFFGGIILLMILIVALSLGMQELTAYFFVLGIVCGIVYRMPLNDISKGFVEGMQQMVYPAMLVGLATGISIILEQGNILDTIIYGISLPLNYVPRIVNGGCMMLMQACINLFIPSGTGQAIVTMPLMAPLADVIGVPRQVAVLAYQIGDGCSNSIIPTSGMLMAAIALGKISYSRWFKFAGKWLIMQLSLGFVFLMIAVAIDWGPF